MVLPITDRRYVQPVARHRQHPERLLLHDERDHWFLWTGQDGDDPVTIEPALAAWMARRPELFPFPQPLMWFAIDDLPLATWETGVSSN
ncbi:MAG: hypothetical protein H0W06_08975 [Chloroflexia bacterium]|nr:hypothetical protein [Chloroflexia bacterium]